jgi:hypothetical protein
VIKGLNVLALRAQPVANQELADCFAGLAAIVGMAIDQNCLIDLLSHEEDYSLSGGCFLVLAANCYS